MKYKINQLLRSQAFYLIKKYTSLSFLNSAYQLEKDFVNTFENQLKTPPLSLVNQVTEYEQEQHEIELIYYLEILSQKEKGFLELWKSPLKSEAYGLIFEGGFINKIFGRYGDEQGLVYDAFYQNLGLKDAGGYIYESGKQKGYIKKLLDAGRFWDVFGITVFNGEYSIPNQHEPIYKKWSYESLFGKNYWPPLREIVEPIIPCPPYNKNTKGEIESGEEIQITGIYEPWFEQSVYEKLTHDPDYNPYVGCPNYFLADSIATRYKLEGTNQEYEVKWRLIWEDQRYLDGKIPVEEQAYSFDLAHIVEKS